jgi:hypothetical protein
VEYWSLEWSEGFFLRSLRLLFSGRKNCVLKRRAEKGEETGEGGARVGQVTWDGGRLVVQEITMVKDPRRQMGPGDQPALQVKKKDKHENSDAHAGIVHTAYCICIARREFGDKVKLT